MSKYAKAVAAAILAGLTAAASFWPGNHWVTIAIAVVTVLAVYFVPNSTGGTKQ